MEKNYATEKESKETSEESTGKEEAGKEDRQKEEVTAGKGSSVATL